MSGKTAIVTGASSGIGRKTAIALSAAGWNVVLTGRRLSALSETLDLIPSPASCLIVPGDITSELLVAELFAKTVERFGRLDLLFNNAGIGAPQLPIEDLTLRTFQEVLNVNLIGSFLCTREAVRVFKTQSPQGGRIINNGSLSAHVPRPHSSPYTCSKHAISGLTKCTALDGRAFNITCTQIDIGINRAGFYASGYTNTHIFYSGNAHTELAQGHTAGALQPDGRTVPEPTFDIQHVADAIVHIASLPNDVTVLEYQIMAAGVPFVGRG